MDKIKTVIIALAFGWALLLSAAAQSPISSFPPGSFSSLAASAPASTSSYCGPGDGGACNGTIGGLAFYSLGRAYNAAYANGTNPLVDMVAFTGGAAVCTLRVSTTGYADLTAYCPGSLTPSAACAAASGGSCLASKIYDQSGAKSCGGSPCHLDTTPGSTTRPAIVFSALNGLPCISTNATQALASASAISSQLAPYSFTIVGKIQTPSNGRMLVVGALQAGILDNGTDTVRMNAGTTLNATASDASYHALIGIAKTGTAGSMVVDGSATTGTTGTTTINSNISMGTDSAGANGVSFRFCEGGIWPSEINYTNMNSNMHSTTSGWNF